ncbi:MAG: PRC-barrel domain-containing protein [Xanthobacteraceae bacterium]
MKTLATAIAFAAISTAALAQSPPSNSMSPPTAASPNSTATRSAPATLPKDFTVSNYYKQSVYDRQDNSIGKVDDVLIDKEGKITSLIIGVGGFLGMGEKDVAVKFEEVKLTSKNDKWYLVMNANKDALKAAPGLKYDRNTTVWIPDTNSNAASNTPSNAPSRN